ncbi:MAG TPA: FAD-dependent oxidoreductase [Gemmatimonadaceae bacterium]|nr:FAD-dependent oxidoreductase [Gemmatimonadaceae bacterium]
MSRTPLFRVVRRSLRLARASLTVDTPIAELIDEGRERARLERSERQTMTRRRFVALSSSAAAGLAIAGCAPAVTRAARGPRPVLIVGAGMAGLTAGYRLRQAGMPVRILEAQRRPGGRMYSLRDHFPDGQVCELGGELIDTGHSHIRGMAAEFGIQLDDLSVDDPAVDQELYFFGGVRRSETEIVTAFRPIASRIATDLATIGGNSDISFRAPNGAEQLDRMTLEEWLGRSGADGWIRSLLAVAYTAEFGLEPERQSALNLLTMIDPEPDPFRIFGESDERFHVRGGNDRMTTALAERLGDAVETGMRLEAVTELADGSFRCAVRRDASTVDIEADHVLLALPFTLLRDVRLDMELPGAKRRAIAELGYGTNAKLMIGVSERVWRTRHRSNGSTLSELPHQSTWETSRAQAGRSGILTNFTGGNAGLRLRDGTAAERAADVARQLEVVFPGMSAAREGQKEARFHWPSFPFMRGSYACYLPGQWTGIAGVEGEAVRNLHFAGEHCSRDAQGFMEGACETGERAAKEILATRRAELNGVGQALLTRLERGRASRRGALEFGHGYSRR